MGKQRVVIVGSGMASVAMVKALLTRDVEARLDISVLGAQGRGAFDRRGMKALLRAEGGAPSASASALHDAAWFERQRVRSQLGARVRLVERIRRRVHVDGASFPYDKLILATGASAYLPPVRGLLAGGGGLRSGVFLARSFDDCVALAGAAGGARRIAVLGGGQHGLCVLDALARRGVELDLFEVTPRLLGDHLDDYGSELLRARTEVRGARVHFGMQAREVLGGDRVEGLRFSDGSSIECELLVLAAGGQPCTWLAFQSGLSVERGVLVDGHFRSVDDPDVYALGACAQWRARVSSVPEEIEQQAEVVAGHLLSGREAPSFVGRGRGRHFELLGLDFFALGRAEGACGDDVFLTSEPSVEKYKKLVWRRGRLVSALLVGDTRRAQDIEQLCVTSLPATREQRASLLDIAP